MQYCRWLDGSQLDVPVGKVVCVGRNYLNHINELDNERPAEPVLFIKPDTCVVDAEQPFRLPEGQGSCHNEVELALLITQPLTGEFTGDPLDVVSGIGIGLDLTLRDVQRSLKSKGLPWERAKAFDGACPVTAFAPVTKEQLRKGINFYLKVNGTERQRGDTRDMLWGMASLLDEIRQVFTLKPGDIVFTGTPAGVGPLHSGDELEMGINDFMQVHSHVR